MAIPVASFVKATPKSREHNAIVRAIDLKPLVKLIGRYKDERYYRVQTPKRPAHCVVTWKDMHGIRQARCDCPAHFVPFAPVPCVHIAAAIIEESRPRKRRKRRA